CANDKDAPPDGDDVSPTEGPRFKCLGNSMAVPVMRWLAERIDAEFRRAVASGSYVPSLDASNLRRKAHAFDPHFAPPISPVDGRRRAYTPWAWKKRPERQAAATAKMLAKLDSDKHQFDWTQKGGGRPLTFTRNLLALIAERMDDALIACHRDRMEVVSRSLGVL
ncbi:MAG: DNA cytosine methyltransferase, partial [Alphaproteobacteria bacterium]|nr:DNA cytosine methyltransferase [Alphaproteobacteria bacterium]